MNLSTRPNPEGPGPFESDALNVDSLEGGGASGGGGLSVGRFLTSLRRFWWVPLLTLLAGVGGGLAYVRMIPPAFVSRAQMWEAVKIRLPEGALFSEDIQNFIGTQSELLRSAVVQKMAFNRLRGGGTNNAIVLGKDGRPLPIDIQLRQAAKSAVYTLVATGADAEYTRAYLDAVIQAYLEYKRDVRKNVSSDTLASISEQVQRAERDLKDAQDSFANYQRTNNLAVLQQESTVAGGYLAQLRTRLADLELEAQLLESSGETGEGLDAGGAAGTGAVPAVIGAAATGEIPLNGIVPLEVMNARRELNVLEERHAKLSQVLRPKHPKMVKLEAEMAKLREQVEGYMRQNRRQLATVRRAIQMKTENVKTLIDQWQRNVMNANRRIAEAQQLQLQVQRAQTVYDRLVLLVQNVGISRNIDQDTLAVLEPASPARRSYERETSKMAMATVGGLGLGLVLIALISLRDDRLASHLDVSHTLGTALVGQVPEVTGEGRSGVVPALVHDDQRYAFAEAYRSLRSALFFLDHEVNRPRTILVTSAIPSEGKSTVALNLAKTLAFGGSKVLLVDADMRRGRLHEHLGAEKSPGLAEVLEGSKGASEAIIKDGLPNLCFLPRGTARTNPCDLLLQPQFEKFLEASRRAYEYVVIDSSPVFAADDTGTIGPKVDGVLFVVRRNYSRSALVREALETLTRRRARVLGLVFNRANTSSSSYHYYRYAEYHRAAG